MSLQTESGSEVTYPIPRPSQRASLVYAHPKVKASLQVQMRLEDDVDKFFDLVTLIRHTAARYVDVHVPYKMQDTNIIKKIEAEVLSKSAAIRNEYEDGWPILSYLKIALKSHKSTRENDSGGSGGPAIKRKHNPMRDNAHSFPYSKTWDNYNSISFLLRKGLPQTQHSFDGADMHVESSDIEFLSSNSERSCDRSKDDRVGNVACSGPNMTGVPVPATPGRPTVSRPRPWCIKRRRNRAEVVITNTSAERLGNHVEGPEIRPSVRATVSDLSCPLKQLPTTTSTLAHGEIPAPPIPSLAPQRRPISNETRQSVETSNSRSSPTRAPTPDPRPTAPAHASPALTPTTPEAGGTFRDLLRARMLPAADVERIAALFASHGVSEGAYVRVFARMASRDAWLRELRERGLLSEMQFFVVRDVFERVAAADE